MFPNGVSYVPRSEPKLQLRVPAPTMLIAIAGSILYVMPNKKVCESLPSAEVRWDEDWLARHGPRLLAGVNSFHNITLSCVCDLLLTSHHSHHFRSLTVVLTQRSRKKKNSVLNRMLGSAVHLFPFLDVHAHARTTVKADI